MTQYDSFYNKAVTQSARQTLGRAIDYERERERERDGEREQEK